MNYEIEQKPTYKREIRKLENSDPASAEDTFNPLFSQIINNVEAVRQKTEEKLDKTETAADSLKLNNQPAGYYATASSMNEHLNTEIKSAQGVHGLRYHDGEFQIKNGVGVWESAGNSGIPPSNTINPTVTPGNGKLTIRWGDPGDTVIDGQTVCTWRGTKLVQKIGSFPENVNDGVLILDNRERNRYAVDGFVVSNLQNGVEYYFQLFPYSDKRAINENLVNRLKNAPFPFKTMTVKIDLNNSNPATCCTYYDDAVGMTPGSAEWDEFFGHYPCLFKDGREVGKLKRDDFTKFENGSPADITSGNAGDVMIAFPRRGVRIITEGNIITVSMTDDLSDAHFKYYAHTRGSRRKERFYIGAYKGYRDGSKLKSLSGKLPLNGPTIEYARSLTRGNGTGYDLFAFYQLTFIQVMYLLKYKHLNSQEVVGKGYIGGNYGDYETGVTNTKGMDYGETTERGRMKLFGIEDLWGVYYDYLDGVFSDEMRNILIGNDNFNSTSSGYINHGLGRTSDLSGYLKKVQGTTEMGFLGKEVGASTTTFFCDYHNRRASRYASFGASYTSNGIGGIFFINFVYENNCGYNDCVGRLMYL